MTQRLYMQIYDYYKNLIESSKMEAGSRLPSIRQLAAERNVSRTTVETAYMCLCDDGYIIPKSQSGYFVSKRKVQSGKLSQEDSESVKKEYMYDFTSSGVDPDSFDLSLWRRYLKSALRQTDRMLHYGKAQGEEDLREEIAKFASQNRNCICDKSNIVIGAGVQTLLQILCPLLPGERTVSFDDLSYVQGTSVFKNYGFDIKEKREDAGYIYVSPSYSSHWGDTMQINERFALTEYARENNKYIIEDDYGSEFRYLNKPTPSLQGLAGGENVIYIGTFSKLLLPSIRISYMILPDRLSLVYTKQSYMYNQTVSRADQIALCSFIRDGHLSSQIKKSRKLYQQKSQAFTDILKKEIGKDLKIIKTDSPLFVCCDFPSEKSSNELLSICRDRGLNYIDIDKKGNKIKIAFSISSIPIAKMDEAAKILKEAIKS